MSNVVKVSYDLESGKRVGGALDDRATHPSPMSSPDRTAC